MFIPVQNMLHCLHCTEVVGRKSGWIVDGHNTGHGLWALCPVSSILCVVGLRLQNTFVISCVSYGFGLNAGKGYDTSHSCFQYLSLICLNMTIKMLDFL